MLSSEAFTPSRDPRASAIFARGAAVRRHFPRVCARPVELPRRIVPVRRPDAVKGLRPFRPCQHGFIKGMPQAVQSAVRCARVCQHVVGVDHRRGVSPLLRHHVEDLCLLDKADGAQGNVGPFLRIAGQHAFGRADQESVGELADPAAVIARQHVVGHVLLVEEGLCRGAVHSRPACPNRCHWRR